MKTHQQRLKEQAQTYRDLMFPIGKQFGKWVVIDNTTSTKKSRGILCRCECGLIKQVYLADLTESRSRSCLKCARNDKISKEKKLATFKKKRDLSIPVGSIFGSRCVINNFTEDGSVQLQCSCGTISYVQQGNLLRGHAESCGCVTSNTSRPEIYLKEWLAAQQIESNKGKLGGVEFDLLIPSKQIALEYNGSFWHTETNGKSRQYHISKTKLAKLHGFRLIHIWEHLYIKRPAPYLAFIRSALGLNSQKIPARKCVISQLPIKISRAFLDLYHIQGSSNGVILSLGLEHNGKLYAVAQFGKHHRNNKDMVLKRFCTLPDVTVVGGLSRLSSAGLIKLNVPYLVSWADQSFSEARGYVSAGWKIDKILPPDYGYTKGGRYYSKQSRSKRAVNTPKGMTESEHAQRDKLHKIWDCGKVRLVFRRD